MNKQSVLILERSSQNLKKISKDGKTILEGVFAEFGVENRNGRVYEEKEYLPHLEYLKKDIANGNLLGELDHPERFEVSLGNVSHKINELWYDQNKRQILGRIEVLEGTPRGQIAKALLDSNIPLSISSRAAGTVNEDKTVQIQQIYTYDLVAKPGFEGAQLHAVNESANPHLVKIAKLYENLNNNFTEREKNSLNTELGIINENISIYDVTDKFASVELREEAKSLIKNNKKEIMENEVNEEAVQKWTVFFKKELSNLNERLDNFQGVILENGGKVNVLEELKTLREYVDKLRKIQESAINWQTDIAKAVNKVGRHSDKVAEKSNNHYDLTKKIVETVDHNAKTLNATAETVDYNANMLNAVNEWNTDMAKAINKLNEWGEEKAVAINDMHEWTSSIAKNLNHAANYTEEQLGRAMNKKDAQKLIEYIEVVAESKKNPELKEKINEMLTRHSITNKKLEEYNITGLTVLDTETVQKKVGNSTVGGVKGKEKNVEVDSNNTIVSKFKNVKLKKEGVPKGLFVLDSDNPKGKGVKISLKSNGKGILVLDATKTIGKGKENVGGDGPTPKMKSNQNLKLDQKPSGKLKETKVEKDNKLENMDRTNSINERSSNITEKLDKIVKNLEKERVLDEEVKSNFPFTKLLSESDRKRFAGLSLTDKQKVATEVEKVPTVESEVINKLWENALTQEKVDIPLWLQLAPDDYKKVYEESPQEVKETIHARAEFYNLDTKYQIYNFWQTSGLNPKPPVLNESVTASTKKEGSEIKDPLVDAVAKKMATYNMS